MIPYSFSLLRSPNIVWVLPLAVCPYAKIVVFLPCSSSSMWFLAIRLYTYSCVANSLQIPSKLNWLLPSSTIVSSYLNVEVVLGLNLQNTRIWVLLSRSYCRSAFCWCSWSFSILMISFTRWIDIFWSHEEGYPQSVPLLGIAISVRIGWAWALQRLTIDTVGGYALGMSGFGERRSERRKVWKQFGHSTAN